MTHAYGRRDALIVESWTKRVKDVRLMERHDDALFEIDRPPKYLLHDLAKTGGQKRLAIGYPSRPGKSN
jgi:hypothetical protein